MGYILGLSYNYHDAAAALIKDGALIAASTEERHSRRKHDATFPVRAVSACLDIAGVTPPDLSWVVYYEQPLVKFDRILGMALRHWRNGGQKFLRSTVENWAAKGKFDVRAHIAHRLGIAPDRIRICEHHLSHAASAFFCSPFDGATIVTLDGVGEWETGSVWAGKGNSLKKISSVRFPHSLGLFYSALTAFLGFEVNEGEYKVMGLAAFGEPVFKSRLLDWFDLRRSGSFRVKHELLEFDSDSTLTIPRALTEAFGSPRVPESKFDPSDSTSQHYANVASSVQAATEEIIEHVVRGALARTGVNALCLAGGVALNSAANGRLRRTLGVPMFVQPASGDAGGALGAAKWLYHCQLDGRNREPLSSAALGTPISQKMILSEVRTRYGTTGWTEYRDDASLCNAIASLLHSGKVVGWFQGRSEWGPRALGYRSILANPCLPEMKAVVNEKIKFREPFRPFAPSVHATRAHEYFDIEEIKGEDPLTNPYNFMLATCSVRSDAVAKIPAVTHVDGTARVQLVRKDSNPLFHQLIAAFCMLSGVPVVLNTSFNLRGEPIVDSPKDAIVTFEWSGLDALAIGRVLIIK